MGVVGLKSTYGEVSLDGVIPLSRSLDHAGVFARSVSDAWAVYRGRRFETEELVSLAHAVERALAGNT